MNGAGFAGSLYSFRRLQYDDLNFRSTGCRAIRLRSRRPIIQDHAAPLGVTV